MKNVKHWFTYKRKQILRNRKFQSTRETPENFKNSFISTTQETIIEEEFSNKNSMNSISLPQINNSFSMQNPQISHNYTNHSHYFHNNPQFYRNNGCLFNPQENSMLFSLGMTNQIMNNNVVNQLLLQGLMNKQMEAVKNQQFFNNLNNLNSFNSIIFK